jgi:putative flippase GtrA
VRTATQFAKYVAVAMLSAASDWVVFAALFAAFGSPITAQAISRIAGAMVSFSVNKYWSFQSAQHALVLVEARRFLLLFVASYALSLSLVATLGLAGLSPYVAKLISDTTCFFFNFLVMRLWVYRQRGREKAAPAASLQSNRQDRPQRVQVGPRS